MREKIWKIIKYKCGYNEATDQILTLISEEIEKVENPYDGERLTGDFSFAAHRGVEVARKKILALLK